VPIKRRKSVEWGGGPAASGRIQVKKSQALIIPRADAVHEETKGELRIEKGGGENSGRNPGTSKVKPQGGSHKSSVQQNGDSHELHHSLFYNLSIDETYNSRV